MVKKEEVFRKLREILDPELGINIVDLGLIYDVKVRDRGIFILMTLTFPGCPFGPAIKQKVISELEKLKEVGKIELEITFDPPWDIARVSEKVRSELGFA